MALVLSILDSSQRSEMDLIRLSSTVRSRGTFHPKRCHVKDLPYLTWCGATVPAATVDSAARVVGFAFMVDWYWCGVPRSQVLFHMSKRESVTAEALLQAL